MAANVKASLDKTNYYTHISSGEHHIIVDEPIDKGGENKGLKPTELLASSLASCTAITLRMYMERKGWTAEKINVSVNMRDPNEEKTTHFERKIEFEGADFSEDQIKRLEKIADACPVHKILMGTNIVTTNFN